MTSFRLEPSYPMQPGGSFPTDAVSTLAVLAKSRISLPRTNNLASNAQYLYNGALPVENQVKFLLLFFKLSSVRQSGSYDKCFN